MMGTTWPRRERGVLFYLTHRFTDNAVTNPCEDCGRPYGAVLDTPVDCGGVAVVPALLASHRIHDNGCPASFAGWL